MKNKEKQHGAIELSDEVLEEVNGGKLIMSDATSYTPPAPPPPHTPTTKEKFQAFGHKVLDAIHDVYSAIIPF